MEISLSEPFEKRIIETKANERVRCRVAYSLTTASLTCTKVLCREISNKESNSNTHL